MQNNARIGGVLAIIAGAFGIFWLIGLVFFMLVFYLMPYDSFNSYEPMMPNDFLTFFLVINVVIGGVFTLAGVLAIIGGIFSIRRNNWGLALAGAIAGTVTFFPCGVPALIFIAIGRNEFEPGSPPGGLGGPVQPVSGEGSLS